MYCVLGIDVKQVANRINPFRGAQNDFNLYPYTGDKSLDSTHFCKNKIRPDIKQFLQHRYEHRASLFHLKDYYSLCIIGRKAYIKMLIQACSAEETSLLHTDKRKLKSWNNFPLEYI